MSKWLGSIGDGMQQYTSVFQKNGYTSVGELLEAPLTLEDLEDSARACTESPTESPKVPPRSRTAATAATGAAASDDDSFDDAHEDEGGAGTNHARRATARHALARPLASSFLGFS